MATRHLEEPAIDRWPNRVVGVERAGERLFVLPLTLGVFLNSLAGFAMGPFLPAIARDLGTTVGVLGQVPATAALAMGVLGLVVGPIADRLGHRRTLVLSLASLAISGVGVGLAMGMGTMLAALLFGALGRAAVGPVSQAIVAARLVDDRRRWALGWITAGTSGAVVVGVPALTSIEALAGWRGAFVATSLLAVGTTCLVLWVVPRESVSVGGGRRLAEVLASYRPIVGDRPTFGLILGTMLGVAGTVSVLTYLGAYLVERHGLSTQEIGWVYLAIGAGAFAGSLGAGGRLGARPLRPLLIASRVGISALAGGSLLLPLPTVAMAGVLTLALTLVAVSTVATGTLLTGETRGSRATTMALNGSASSLGSALGASIGGWCLGLGGFALLAGAIMLWYGAAAAMVWWSRPATRVT